MATDPLHPIDAARRQKALILGVVRSAFLILIITVGLLTVLEQGPGAQVFAWWFPITVGGVLFALALAIDLLTPNKKIATISGVFLGLLGGLLTTVAFSLVFDLLLRTYLDQRTVAELAGATSLVKLLVGVSLCYLGIATVLQTQDDFRLVIPYVEFAKELRGPRPLILDTSAVIDARVADLAELGLFSAPLVIPHFVIGELQALSDSQDRLKRARGRRGLDVIQRLQRTPDVEVVVDATPIPGRHVDARLAELAQRMSAAIVTTDTGLQKVARIQGIKVINLNEVAMAARPAMVPGQSLAIRIVREGEQSGQGVGYLDDGAMVVIEHAAQFINEMVQAEVTSTIQTSAGRMVFAALTGESARYERPALPLSEGERGEAGDEPEADEGSDASGGAGPVDQGPPPASSSSSSREARSPYPPVKPRGKRSSRNPRR